MLPLDTCFFEIYRFTYASHWGEERNFDMLEFNMHRYIVCVQLVTRNVLVVVQQKEPGIAMQHAHPTTTWPQTIIAAVSYCVVSLVISEHTINENSTCQRMSGSAMQCSVLDSFINNGITPILDSSAAQSLRHINDQLDINNFVGEVYHHEKCKH